MTPVAKDHALPVMDRRNGFTVAASKENADALVVLFKQYEIPCKRVTGPEKDTLVFMAGTDRDRVEQILLEYEASET